jgi:hypothetical protein
MTKKQGFIAAALLLIALTVFWVYKSKQVGNTANVKTAAASGVELSASDIVIAQKIDMTQGLPVSGTVKAVQSAMVKARVAGELMMLEVREGDAVIALPNALRAGQRVRTP